MRIIFRIRPLNFMFRKNWYSLYRWKNPYETYYNEKYNYNRVIDIGFITIGYATKIKKEN